MKSSLDYVRDDFLQLVEKEGLPQPTLDYLLWQSKFPPYVHPTLDAAWPDARIAVLFEAPPWKGGGSVICNHCRQMVTREVPGTEKRLPVRHPNLEYQPDLLTYNLAVACGWKILRVNRTLIHKHPERVVEPLAILLEEAPLPIPSIPPGGRVAPARGAILAWLLLNASHVTEREVIQRTGISIRGIRYMMDSISVYLPIIRTAPGIWRWKRREELDEG